VDLMAGSVVVTVAAHAGCPVVAVRESEPEASTRRAEPVVLGVDGLPAGEAATAFAFDAAARRNVPLVAVHAWSDLVLDPERDRRRPRCRAGGPGRAAGRLGGKYPEVSVRRRLVRDRPARALVEESAGAQLVVVSSRGRGGLAGMLLGSVSRAVLHRAHCPVAIVPPTALAEGDESD
jgi:nucleotide-binding universal stress UspA family protein